MRRTHLLVLLATTVAALGAAAPAGAGGWASAELVPPPAQLDAGEPWMAQLKVLQHGRTPLDGVSPSVTISRAGVAETFPAVPTGEPGRYVANVVFPATGTWTTRIDNGFGGVQAGMPVGVRAPSEAASASATPALIVGGAVIALILITAAWLLLRPERAADGRGLRRSRPASAS